MGRMQDVAHFLGLRRSMFGLLGMVILVGMGERMAERFLPLYLSDLGGGDRAIGIFSGLTVLLGALYSFPGGYLSDHLGTKRALLVFNAMAMVGYTIVLLFPYWQAAIVGSLFFLSWSAISLPATMGLVSKALPKSKRTMGVSMHSLVRRFPMALGPVLGGFFMTTWGLQLGIRVAFGVALGMALVSIVLQQRLIADDHPTSSAAEKNPFRILRRMSPDLTNLLISDILIRFCEQIPYAFVVIWCVKMVAAPVSEFQFGILTAIEMAVAVLCYIPVAYYADRSGKKLFVVMTFVFFTLFPISLLLCHSFWLLVFAFVLRGLKEFGEPTRKALIMDLAPEDCKAAMFGLYYLIRDCTVSMAAFGGAFIWHYISPQANFWTAFACGVLGTIWFAWRGRDLTIGVEKPTISKA